MTLISVKVFIFSVAASAALASNVGAQAKSDANSIPSWSDTTRESFMYPIGDAVPVYRAVLDLLYQHGDRRPSIIVLNDTVEERSVGPCSLPSCPEWPHRSNIDTATIIAFVQLSPKRPILGPFSYPIPIDLLSKVDLNLMDAGGRQFLAVHPEQMNRVKDEWIEFQRQRPGAWDAAVLTKTGFNPSHSQALVEVRRFCGEQCYSDEILFLVQTDRKWRVVERIPNRAKGVQSIGNLRYVDPEGTSPQDSELLTAAPSGSPSEATARTAVYRVILDSLYSFHGERPTTIVLIDGFRIVPDALPPHKSAIGSVVLKKYALLGTLRAPLDVSIKTRVPLARVGKDSLAALEARGHILDPLDQLFSPFWLGFVDRYHGAWGIVGLSRIAFNADLTEALVYSDHTCGVACEAADTWLLVRSGKRWKIAERMPRIRQSRRELDPLRYLGVDADPNDYRPQYVHATVIDATTGRRLPHLRMRVRPSFPFARVVRTDPIVRTDKSGRLRVRNWPRAGGFDLEVACPAGSDYREIHAMTIVVRHPIDTTASVPIDFRECKRTPPVAPVNELSGAQAIIGPTEARFIFPRRSPDRYTWDAPREGANGTAEYHWEVDWDMGNSRDYHTPEMLGLTTYWKRGGPHRGSLRQMIAGETLEAMINCRNCDAAVQIDQEIDHKNFFATVENGQLVFIVRGADAVQHIFPIIPSTVRFWTHDVRGALPDVKAQDPYQSQSVTVNCRNSSESTAARHRCDLQK